MKKIMKSNLFRFIWLLSVIVFVGNIAYTYLAFGKGTENMTQEALMRFAVIFILSFVIGALAFALWVLSIINKRLSNRFSSYISLRNKILKPLLFAIPILFIALIATYLFIASPITVSGTSMPIYNDGSRRIVCKICKEIKRNDVIVYSNPEDGKQYIGRVVGLPNETIVIENGQLSVNGSFLTEPYAEWSEWNLQEKVDIKLNSDEYLALFDRRKMYVEPSEFIKIHKFKKNNYVGKIL